MNPYINKPSWLGLYNTSTASLRRGKTQAMSILIMTLNYLMAIFSGALGNMENPLIAISLSPLWPGVVAPDRVLFMGQIKL